MNSIDKFAIEPMSAGDIIDRAVRLYRSNFLVLVRIVLGPGIVAYTGWILLSIGTRNFSFERGDFRLVLMMLLIFSGGLLFLAGKVAFYAVLGGASRSLAYHFFDGTPLSARDVFQSVREKLWSLIGAMVLVGLVVLAISVAIFYAVAIISAVYGMLVASVIADLPNWFLTISNSIFGILLVFIVVGSLLLVYSRVVYVPQVLMVEGKGVFQSIGRSFSLARGGGVRIAALILFWIYVAWSLWILLMIPLGWYGYWMGVDINPFGTQEPLWYDIARQTLTQLSEILIAPIAMLGFTLLFIDSKVRKEGFDVELLANRLLPPPAPQTRQAFSPHHEVKPEPSSWAPSILGLGLGPADHNPTPVIPLASASASFESALNRTEGEPGLVPVETIDLPAPRQQNDPAIIPGPIVRESVITVQLDNARRACRWCGTEAGVQDRFCRVCGSLF